MEVLHRMFFVPSPLELIAIKSEMETVRVPIFTSLRAESCSSVSTIRLDVSAVSLMISFK